MTSLERIGFGLVLAAGLVLAGARCSSDPNPSPSSTFTGGNGGSGGSAGGGGSGGSCDGPEGCYDCEPTETEHFLNACTDAQCSPFDNEGRLPLYNGGDLPPVP